MGQIIADVIQRWRSHRNKKMLESPFIENYAFIGVGSHAVQNLYPVLQYLGIHLKYICCRNPDKLQMIERRYGVEATTSMDKILDDKDVKGVFVCASPHNHFDICKRVINSGKYLFVEKPPCLTVGQLETLIAADKCQTTMVGMQKRYSPLTEALAKRLPRKGNVSYTLSYHTGAYPEGNPFTDLFIHPVDLALYLFGRADVGAVQHIGAKDSTTVQIMLSHGHAAGFIELSTAHSWTSPEESFRINTISGEYRLEQMERLSYKRHPEIIAGIPIEKTGRFTASEQILAGRNNFSPLIENNQLYTQGFLSEIKRFADMVEHSRKNLSPLTSLLDTYKLLATLQL